MPTVRSPFALGWLCRQSIPRLIVCSGIRAEVWVFLDFRFCAGVVTSAQVPLFLRLKWLLPINTLAFGEAFSGTYGFEPGKKINQTCKIKVWIGYWMSQNHFMLTEGASFALPNITPDFSCCIIRSCCLIYLIHPFPDLVCFTVLFIIFFPEIYILITYLSELYQLINTLFHLAVAIVTCI